MDLNKTGLLYVGIDNNKQVISVYFGEEEEIKKELPEGHDIVLVTQENTPINQYYYYDGNKFVKELNNVI
jgi:hypothetical protein